MEVVDWKIDTNSPIPFYYQLEKYFEQLIESGVWAKGIELPSEGEISSKYEISIGVVRQALKRLEQKNYISRRKGKKAVVISEPKVTLEFIAHQISHYESLKNKGFKIKTKVLENCLINPSEKISSILNIDLNATIIKLSRLRFISDQPMLYWKSYLPTIHCPGLEKIDLNNRSLYQVLLDEFNIKPNKSRKSIEVVTGPKHILELLNLPLNEPLVYIESVSYFNNDKCIEFYEGWHKAQNYKFVFQSSISS